MDIIALICQIKRIIKCERLPTNWARCDLRKIWLLPSVAEFVQTAYVSKILVLSEF